MYIVVKLIHSEKATKFDEISKFYLKLISGVIKVVYACKLLPKHSMDFLPIILQDSFNFQNRIMLFEIVKFLAPMCALYWRKNDSRWGSFRQGISLIKSIYKSNLYYKTINTFVCQHLFNIFVLHIDMQLKIELHLID